MFASRLDALNRHRSKKTGQGANLSRRGSLNDSEKATGDAEIQPGCGQPASVERF